MVKEESEMEQAKLIELCRTNTLTATIISTADSPHYLVGGEDSQGNFYSMNNREDQPIIANSLEQAKVVLKANGIDRAIFEMQTPYDEMIGAPADTTSRLALQF